MSKPFSRENLYPEKVIDMLFAACADLIDRYLLTALVYCGVRVSELAHMKAIWWTGEAIKVPKQEPCSCVRCKARGYWTPKTKAGARVIPVRPFYRPLFDNYFKQNSGTNLGERAIQLRLKRIARRAGLTDVNVFPHAFRATLASHFAGMGVDQWVMKEFFGWSSIVSADAYIQVSTERIEADLKKKGAWR